MTSIADILANVPQVLPLACTLWRWVDETASVVWSNDRAKQLNLDGGALLAVPSLYRAALRTLVDEPQEIDTLRVNDGVYRAYLRRVSFDTVLVIFEDCTEEYTAFQKMVLSEQENTRRLKQQSEDLLRSNQDLERFAYVASHDLQEPLRMVSSYLSLIEEEIGESLSSDVRQFLAFAVDGAQRMQQLITDLLKYSRVGRNAEVEEVSISEVLDDMELILNGSVAKNGASLVRETEFPTVWGTKTSLVRVFLNLVSNAMKFARIGVPVVIRIGAEQKKDGWLFYVKDNGQGLDMRYADRIFEVFQRLSSTTEGTGIGLAECKKVVGQHGGSIWVEAEQGAGATFFFTIPNKLEQA